MNGPPTSERFLQSLLGSDTGGWEFLNGGVKDPVEIAQDREKEAEERARLAAAAAKVFNSDEGKLVLDAFVERTLLRVSFYSQLGLPADQVGVWGAFREGQNAFVYELLKLIAEGNGEELPPRKE